MPSDAPALAAPGDESPESPRLDRRGPLQRGGRPKGARNRRSLDLARYIAHSFGGLTPGQQSAAVALISPEELEDAPGEAERLRISAAGLSPILLAMAVKATHLGRALGCSRGEAWVLMAKERVDLMGYVHQKQPAAEQGKAGAQLPTVFVVNDGEPQPLLPGLADDDADDVEFVDVLDADGGDVT